MKKVIKSLKSWAHDRRMVRMAKREASLCAEVARESEVKLQAREFCGELFLCYCDVPILPADSLSCDLPTAIDVAREAYRTYEEDQRKRASWGRK